MPEDRVRLTVPARSEYAIVVRMVATSFVAHMDLGFDKVDEIRLAAEEAFVYGVEVLRGEGEVSFQLGVTAGGLEMEATLRGGLPDAGGETDSVAEMAGIILQAICERCDLNAGSGDERRISLRIALDEEDAPRA